MLPGAWENNTYFTDIFMISMGQIQQNILIISCPTNGNIRKILEFPTHSIQRNVAAKSSLPPILPKEMQLLIWPEKLLQVQEDYSMSKTHSSVCLQDSTASSAVMLFYRPSLHLLSNYNQCLTSDCGGMFCNMGFFFPHFNSSNRRGQ